MTNAQDTGAFCVLCCAVVSFVSSAVPARAELVFFHTGPHAVGEEPSRGGRLGRADAARAAGKSCCESSIIARIAPDEVPYPEPEVEQPAAVLAAVEPAVDVPYGAIIDKVSAEQGVAAKLVRAVIQVESAYQRAGAVAEGAMG